VRRKAERHDGIDRRGHHDHDYDDAGHDRQRDAHSDDHHDHDHAPRGDRWRRSARNANDDDGEEARHDGAGELRRGHLLV
jgi:hypothetical protein